MGGRVCGGEGLMQVLNLLVSLILWLLLICLLCLLGSSAAKLQRRGMYTEERS
jgi:hypothetical protein